MGVNVNQWINYHHLFYFKTIAEEGSVSKAAEKLRIGQPTLSAQLKQFEDHIGVQLFTRENKRLSLTEQGKVALTYAQNIFKMGHEMFEVLHDRVKTSKIQVSVGSLDSIPKQITLKIAKHAFQNTNCQMSFIEGKFDQLIRELTSFKIDLLVSNFLPNSNETKGILHKVLAKSNVCVYGSKKFRNLKKDFPQSLIGKPIILTTYDSKLRYDLDHWMHINKIECDIVAESQDISIKKMLAAEGIGLILTSPYSVAQQTKDEELFEIGTLAGVYEELFLLYAKRRIENQIADNLFKTFKLT